MPLKVLPATLALLTLPALCPTASAQSSPAHLLHPAGSSNDLFGAAVAVDGDVAIVGVPLDNVDGNGVKGSAIVYRRTGLGWLYEATLTADDGAHNDRFGLSVSISGDTALVGASQHDVGTESNQGSAYVFTRSGGAWVQQAHLLAADGARSDAFGYAVSVSGDTAVVTSINDDIWTANQGSAYVFTRSAGVWTQQAKLVATDGAETDSLGYSVSVSGDTAVVGVPLRDVGASLAQGAAYVFVRTGATWHQEAHLSAADGAQSDWFGYSVSLSGNTIVIGAPYHHVGGGVQAGSAYVYTRSGTTWSEQGQLVAGDGTGGDLLGYSVSVSGDTAVVGAPSTSVDGFPDQGAAYLFARSGQSWSQQAKLLDPGAPHDDEFGNSVVVNGDVVVIGSERDSNAPGNIQGSAWVFNLGDGCDLTDFNGDGLYPDTADIDDFLSVFSGGPCSTNDCGDLDFNNDGLFPDTLDIDSLLSVFSGGACL